MRLRYDLELKIRYSGGDVTLKKKHNIIDIREDFVGIYKKESIIDIFSEELLVTNGVKFEILDIKFNGTALIDMFVDEEFIYLCSKEYKLSKTDIGITVDVTGARLNISVNKLNELTYNATVSDEDISFYEFDESFVHYAKSKDISITVNAILNGNVINTETKHLTLNTLARLQEDECEKVKDVSDDVNNHIWQSGIEDREVLTSISSAEFKTSFNIDAFLRRNVASNETIYPKVEAEYHLCGSFDYKVPKFIGEATFKGEVKESASADFLVFKYGANNLITEYAVEAEVKYRDPSDGHKYKTKKISSYLRAEINLYNYLELDIEEKTVRFNLINAISAMENINKPFMESLIDVCNKDGVPYIEFFNYKIKEVNSYLDGIRTEQIVKPYFKAHGDNDIDLSSRIKFSIYPFEGIYTGFKTLSFSNILDTTTVIDKDIIDSIQIEDQNGESPIGTPTVAHKVWCIDKSSCDVNVSGYEAVIIPNKYSYIDGEVKLSNSKKGEIINIGKGIDFKKLVSATVTFTAIEPLYINGERVGKGLTKTLNLSSENDGLFISVRAEMIEEIKTFEIVDKTKRICSCNGVETTFLLESKGKEDYNGGSIPINMPDFGFNIKTKAVLDKINPIAAKDQTVFSQVQGSNTDFSTNINLTSNYTSVYKNETELIDVVTFSEYNIGSNQKREIELDLVYDIDGTYILDIVSNNPSVSIDAPALVNIVNGRATVKVIAYATFNMFSIINPTISPFYFYDKSVEKFLFDEKISTSISGGNCVLNFIPKNPSDPICITIGDTNLTRVTSNLDDNISVAERKVMDSNIFYTKYKNITVSKVLVNGKAKDFECGSYYIKPNCQKGDIVDVVYRVDNSFDYEFKDNKTYIYTSLIEDSIANVYVSGDIEVSVDINPNNTLTDNGYLYIDYENHPLTTVRVIENYIGPNSKNLYYLHLLDINNNNFIGNASVLIGNTKVVCKFENGIGVFYSNPIDSLKVVSDGNEITVNKGDFEC